MTSCPQQKDAIKVHPDKYKKDFDAVTTFLAQYIDKRALTPSVMVAFVARTDPPNGRAPVLPMALLRERS